jgi:hypothetical protein
MRNPRLADPQSPFTASGRCGDWRILLSIDVTLAFENSHEQTVISDRF